MRAKSVKYVAIKRDNMVKSEHERHYYQLISRVRRIIGTRSPRSKSSEQDS